MEPAELEERRRELYGPGRMRAREAARQLVGKDHVQQTFEDDIDGRTCKHPFQSETAKSFRVNFNEHI